MLDSKGNIYEDLNEDFLHRLANYLFELPSYQEANNREDSFKTSEEIKQWSELPYSAEEIDDALLTYWDNGQLENIRPAKYPHQTKLLRLWGHVGNLWPLNQDELQTYRYDDVVTLPDVYLPATAPNIFVSFNILDKDLAIHIRNRFANWGCNAWLYINQIRQGQKIFNEVESAVNNCKAAIVLITSTSIGSAWVYTEFETLTNLGKPICAVFDISDEKMLEVLESWQGGERFNNIYCQDKANRLVEQYEKNNNTHHIKGYEYTVHAFLKSLSLFKIHALYPARPENWDGSANFIGVTELQNALKAYM
jgi:hypothetical protein